MLLLLLLLTLLTACSDPFAEQETATELSITLPSAPSASGSATSSDQWNQSDVEQYTITVTQGSSTVVEATGKPGATVTLPRLASGSYTVTVQGKNSAGTVIAQGSRSGIELNGGSVPVSISITMEQNEHKKDCTLRYDANVPEGEAVTAPDESAHEYGTTVEAAAAPARPGYTFTAWNAAADGSGTAYAAGASVRLTAQTVTLYAQWEPERYLVTFYGNDGEYAGGDLYMEGVSYGTALPRNPFAQTGYVFREWNTEQDGTGSRVTDGAPVDASVTALASGTVLTLYAQWEQRTDTVYIVRHHWQQADSLNRTDEDEVKYGVTGAQTEAVAQTRTGFGTVHPFEQQEIRADGGTVVDIFYDRIEYTITYTDPLSLDDITGMPDPAEQRYRYEQTASAASAPARPGYTFTAWNTAADGSGTTYSAGGTITVTDNMTLYPQWQPELYSVHYKENADSAEVSGMPEDEIEVYKYKDSVKVASATPSRTGHTFKGWSTDSAATAAEYRAGDTFTIYGSTTLYAVWEVKTYRVTYANASGVNETDVTGMPAESTHEYRARVTIPSAAPSRTGYAFNGWSTGSAATTVEYSAGSSFTITENVTLYAVWSQVSGITVFVSPSSDLSITKAVSGTVITLTAASGYSNYTWYVDTIEQSGATSNTFTFNTSDKVKGVYQIYVTAKDSATGIPRSAYISVTVE